MRYLFLIAVAVFLTACDNLVKEVDAEKVPQGDSKPVVHCYISPQDTALTATVTLSRAVLGENTYATGSRSDALVDLSDGSRSVKLLFDNRRQLHWADAKQFPILAGKTYTLTATLANGVKVTATATVPAPVAITESRLDTGAVRRNETQTQYAVQLFWQDPAGTNYYRVAGDLAYGSSVRTTPTGKTDTIRYISPVRFQSDQAMLTDQGLEGRLMTSRKGVLPVPAVNGQIPYLQPIILTTYLLNVDENYYRYHEALERQGNAMGNPFAEPVLLPSNIEGGLGCFGAYNRTQMTLRLK